mmetsp:Transcript_37423/g.98130  ORF Transcript_37423/g.98130 Transcript_37423/m.98130 type:complete len:207 (+) Transcript_37423:76-696(+)
MGKVIKPEGTSFYLYTAAVAALPAAAVAAGQADLGGMAWLGCVAVAAVAGSLTVERQASPWLCVVAAVRCLVALAVAVAAWWAVLVLLGAPVSTATPRTLQLAAQLASATVVPAVVVNRYDASGRRRLLQLLHGSPPRAVDRVAGYAGGAGVTGAWLGAAAIPLDWGAWWQEWPLSCSFGLVTGHLIGVTVALASLRSPKAPAHQL